MQKCCCCNLVALQRYKLRGNIIMKAAIQFKNCMAAVKIQGLTLANQAGTSSETGSGCPSERRVRTWEARAEPKLGYWW